MNIHDLVLKTRSYRRFDENISISGETLLSWIDTARLTMSSVNIQPLKYFLSYKAETNVKIRPHVRWAGLLRDFNGPKEGENPSAYVIICVDKSIQEATPERFAKDVGIAAQTIMLEAASAGYGGCMIGSLNIKEIALALDLPDSWQIALVLALGKPAEKVVLEVLEDGCPSAYYRDTDDVHHVPKRKLEDIVKY
ncbi:MAG: nitroreductase family protein [Eubacteriales bacterium]|jgi:nitroreductase|nr:nitroreductase family protein [Eubacteriales bacterium]